MEPHATSQESGDHREPAGARVSLSTLTLKTVVVHTVTYFCAGVLAYTLGDYERTFAEPPLSYFMRPTTDPWIMAGPMLQPVRGVIFALAFFPLRHVLFASRGGWLILWWLLVALGVLSTFGPAPGSVEGLIYTIIPPVAQVLGLWEVLLQSFLLSALLVYWVNRPGRRWLTWTLGAAFLLVFTFALLGLLVTPANAQGPSPRTAAATTRPNIVWISAEDLSPRLGAYGDRLARTPALDRLAAESVRYTRAFTTAPVCAPSRAAIITGMYQNAIGAHHMRTTEDGMPELPGPYLAVPPFYVKAFPEYLRAAGYYTTNRSKTDYQFGEPFTIWDELGPDAHWRGRPDRSQPFFSVFNITVTHESQAFPDSPSRRNKPLVTDPSAVEVPPYYPDTPAVRQELARLYDNIADMDVQVASILRQLEDDGLAGNTVVFFWGDHGDGVPRAKRSLYDSGLRVPLMIRLPEGHGPGAHAGTVNDELVSFIDLAPTVLALAGAPVPAHMQGRVLIGAGAAPPPRYVFAARDRMDTEYDMMRSARDARFLYIRNFMPQLSYAGHITYRNQSAIMQELLRLQAESALTGAPALWLRPRRPAEELYDVAADPHQIHDVAGDPAHRATLERMREAVADWMRRIADQGLLDEAEMIARMWPGGVQPATAQPYIIARRATGNQTRAGSIEISGPMEVVIDVPTQGASIGYTTDEGQGARWRLYSGPIAVRSPMTLRARAIRYGYKESAEARVVLTN